MDVKCSDSLRKIEISWPWHEICVLTPLFMQQEHSLSWIGPWNGFVFLFIECHVSSKRNNWNFPLTELTEQFLEPVFVFLEAELYSQGIRSKGNVISDGHKFVVWTWVGGGIATVSSLSQRVVPFDSLGVYSAKHVSGKGWKAGCLPWHSLGPEGN